MFKHLPITFFRFTSEANINLYKCINFHIELRFDTLPPCDYMKKIQVFWEMYVELRAQDHIYLNVEYEISTHSFILVRSKLVKGKT